VNVTRTLQRQVTRKAVITRRYDTDFEACYWKLSAAGNDQIEITFERTQNGKFYLYSGLSRQNATAVSNGSTEVGSDARYFINGSEGAIIVFQTTEGKRRRFSKVRGGSGQFAFRSIATKPVELVSLVTDQEKTNWYLISAVVIGVLIAVVFGLNYCKRKKGQQISRD